ncbi:MAG: bacteriophage antitermination protein Q [Vibrio sp.]
MTVRYNKEGLREELRDALLVIPRSRGQLDGFENNGISNRSFQRMSTTDICDEEGTVVFKIKNEVIRTIACKQFKQSPMPLAPHAFKQAQLIRDMNSQDQHRSDWLKYCYSEGPVLPTQDLIKALLDDFYLNEVKGLTTASKTLIKHLALLACQQKRDEINGKKLLTQAYIAQLSNKKLSAWEKSWSERWRRLLSILERYDNQGLDHVYESYRSRKAARRNDNVSVQSSFSFGT